MKRKPVQLAILGDQQSIIDTLKAQLHQHRQLVVSIATTDPGELLCQLTRIPAELVLASDTMLLQNEEELTHRFRELYPNIKIVVWVQEKTEVIDRLIEDKKLDGAVVIGHDGRSMVTALEKLTGTTYFRDKVLERMPKIRLPKKGPANVHLTDRELEIVKLIEQEYSNKQIAQTLYISERTVETHRKNIFRKTSTNSVIGLIKFAYVNKLV